MKSLCIDNDDMTTLMFNESSSVVAAMVTNRLVFIQLSDDEYTYSLVQAAQHTQSILVRGPVKGYNRLCRNDLRIQQFHVTFAKYTRNENNNDEHDDEKHKIIIIIIILIMIIMIDSNSNNNQKMKHEISTRNVKHVRIPITPIGVLSSAIWVREAG